MKDYRDKELTRLLFILFFLFLIWCTPALDHINNPEAQTDYSILLSIAESTIISYVLSNAALLCDCLISSRLKDKLVGLFFLPRSGETVFSKIKNGKIYDDRFELSDAKALYKDIISYLPNKKREKRRYENKKWYNIYHQYQDKPQVVQCQRDYLMCRDLYTEAIAFMLIYVISLFVFPSFVIFSIRFVVLLIILAIAFNICTHQKMRRFVYTVIAIDIANQHNIKESN